MRENVVPPGVCWLLGAPAYDDDADTDGNSIADGGKDGEPV
jgi:hypothetical protein